MQALSQGQFSILAVLKFTNEFESDYDVENDHKAPERLFDFMRECSSSFCSTEIIMHIDGTFGGSLIDLSFECLPYFENAWI